MDYVRDAWYVASWSHEIKDRLIRITIMGENIVLFRSRDGIISALEDRCPHKSLPLSRGRILNDAGFKKSPTKQMPNWLVKFLALFIKELSGVTKSLSKRVDTDKSLAKSLFDWEYISAKDSIIDTAKQLSTSDHN